MIAWDAALAVRGDVGGWFSAKESACRLNCCGPLSTQKSHSRFQRWPSAFRDESDFSEYRGIVTKPALANGPCLNYAECVISGSIAIPEWKDNTFASTDSAISRIFFLTTASTSHIS